MIDAEKRKVWMHAWCVKRNEMIPKTEIQMEPQTNDCDKGDNGDDDPKTTERVKREEDREDRGSE